MNKLGMEPRPTDSAFSFLSKGWRDVRDSADADLQLMRARANSFKNRADRELENLINSAASVSGTTANGHTSSFFPVPASTSIAEFDFVKRISPKLSEFKRAYSSPDFSKKVLEIWSPNSKIGIDLSAIRTALVSSEAEANQRILDMDWKGRRRLRWKVAEEEEWELFRRLKTGFREFEKKREAGEILESLKNSEFVEKVKLSLVCAFSSLA